MILLCGGQIVLHNPDGALDQDAKKSRDERTKAELIKKFGSDHVDREVWGFPSTPAMEADASVTESSDEEPEDDIGFEIIVKDPSKHLESFVVNYKRTKEWGK